MPNEQDLMEDDSPTCPVCFEEIQPIERNFAPCVCAFRICQCCWFRLYDGGKRVCPGCRRNLMDQFKIVDALHAPIKFLYFIQVCEDPGFMPLLDVISHFQSSCPIPSSLFGKSLDLDQQEIAAIIQRLDKKELVTKGTVEGRDSFSIDAGTQALLQRCLGSLNGIMNATEVIQDVLGCLAHQRDIKLVDLTIPHAQSLWTHIVTSPDLIKRFLSLSSTILYALDGNGKARAALDFATLSLAHIARTYGENAGETYTAVNNRAFTLMKVYKFREAYDLLGSLPPIVDSTGEFQSTKILSTLWKAESCRACCLCEIGRTSESLTLSNDLLERIQTSLGKRLISMYEENLIVATIKYRKARTLIRLDRDDEAMAELTAALDSNIANFTERSPKTTVTKKQMALIHVKKNNFEEAMRVYGEIRSVEKEILTENHPQHLVTAAGMAAALNKMGEGDKAFKLCEETLTKFQRVECLDNIIEILMVKRELARVLVGKQRFSVARALLNEILERKLEILGERHPFIQRAVDDVQELC